MRVRRLAPGARRLLASGLLAAGLLAPGLPRVQAADTCGAPLGLPSFDLPPTLFNVQDQPFGIVLGDWNRDGNLDFAATNSGVTGSVSTRFGDGLGGFAGGANIAVGALATPQHLAAGDFNDDGFLDLLVATPGANSLRMLQGSATGTFTLLGGGLAIPGAGPYALAVADFNGDGRDDFAVTVGILDKVRIYLRTGLFAFAAPTVVGLTKVPGSLTVGDFDRDGDLDMVSGSLSDGNISFLENDRNGVFTQPNAPIAVGFNVVAITSGDFDKDGRLDLAVSVVGTPDRIETFKGAGDGTFTPSGTLNAPGAGGVVSITVADVTNDGNLDLVANSTRLLAYKGDGGGGFVTNPENFPGPAGLRGVAVGDVNGDGRVDAAVAALLDDQVGVFLNNLGFPCPNVSFGPAARTFAAGASPVGAVRGDFNKDGRLDAAVTIAPATVSVLLASGPGLFAAPVNYTVGSNAQHVATGDLDGDGLLDLVTTNTGSNNIAILKGLALGTFGPATFLGVGIAPAGLDVADLNGDGRRDIVVANNGGGNVSVLMNTGGGFAPAVPFAAGGGALAVAAGDVNGDNKADIVVAVTSTNEVKVLVGDGFGGFAPGSTFNLGGGAIPRGLVLADFDNDLDRDVATANAGLNTVSILRNDGTGVFALSANVAVGVLPYDIAVGEFNGDGDPDLVVSNEGNATVNVLRGLAADAFATQTYVVPPSPRVPVTGDFTGDGQSDVMVVTLSTAGTTLLVGNGAGALQVAPEFATFGEATDLDVADFNRDGIPDVVVVNSDKNAFTIQLGTAAPGFGAPIITGPLTAPLRVATGDFNSDGFTDVAVLENGRFFSFVNLGGGGTAFSQIDGDDATGTARWIATADFDGDGILDIAVGLDRFPGLDQVWLYAGLGNGQFNPVLFQNIPGNVNPVAVALGDFDADGRIDMATANLGSDTASILTNVSAGPGSFAFGLETRGMPACKPLSIAAADFQGDGRPDLVLGCSGTPDVRYLNNVGGVFGGAATSFPTSPNVTSVAVADFNRDGDLDVAASSGSTGQVSILPGRGDGTFLGPVQYAVAGRPVRLANLDLNRDGRPDLVTANDTRATLSLLTDTNCEQRRMDVVVQPSACNIASVLFSPQPQLQSLDDGANLLQCDADTVTASLLGVPGALLGTPLSSFVPASGTASYTDLAVSASGIAYRLEFTPGLPAVIPARSKRFTVGLQVDILPPPPPPTSICEGVPHTFSATPKVFDRYDWSIGGTPFLGSDTVTIPGQASGSYPLQVNAFFDSCVVTKTLVYSVTANLANVAAQVLGGSTVVPVSGAGGFLGASTENGGAITGFQWSYSTTSGGPYTPIPGATLNPYMIQGADFPGTGIYYVVVTVSAECGGPLTSNEIQVIVCTTTRDGEGVPFLTVTSKSKENTLEWLNPAGTFAGTLIKYDKAPDGTSACAPPASLADGAMLALVPGVAGDKGSYLHSDLPNDTRFCYSAFVHQGLGVFSDPVKSVNGRPFDSNPGPVKWAFSTGMMGPAPGNGPSSVYVVNQDNTLHSALKGPAGGTWPPLWRPAPMNGPAQSRPSSVPVAAFGANQLVFVTSLDGFLYAVNGETGGIAASHSVGLPLEAAPSAMFTAFGGSANLIFALTRHVGGFNGLEAVDLDDPLFGPRWGYGAGPPYGAMGIVVGQPAVDYGTGPGTGRVYFASYAFDPLNTNTIWCLTLPDGTDCPGWSGPSSIGNVTTAVSRRGNRLYVGTDDGRVVAINTADGTQAWSTPVSSDGLVKGFIMTDRLTSDLYFATNTTVRAITDVGSGYADKWSTPVEAPSTPIYLPGDSNVYVGGKVARSGYQLLRLGVADGSLGVTTTLGDGAAIVGSPTFDLAGGYLYVGTEEGVVYCVQLP